jgi:hypothetical protein
VIFGTLVCLISARPFASSKTISHSDFAPPSSAWDSPRRTLLERSPPITPCCCRHRLSATPRDISLPETDRGDTDPRPRRTATPIHPSRCPSSLLPVLIDIAEQASYHLVLTNRRRKASRPWSPYSRSLSISVPEPQRPRTPPSTRHPTPSLAPRESSEDTPLAHKPDPILRDLLLRDLFLKDVHHLPPSIHLMQSY